MSRNRVIGGFEDAIERGQSAVTNSAKKTVKDFAGSAKSQITGSVGTAGPTNSGGQASAPSDSGSGSDQGANENANAAAGQQNTQKSDADRVEFLKDLYGKNDQSGNSKGSTTKGAGSLTQALGIPQSDPNAGKTPEELAKIEALRRQLHADYYQNLLAASRQKEETVVEKIEKEDQMEKMEVFEKDKKRPSPLPSTLKQGTGESVVGVSG